jgi:uncharacterized integral membrane protein
VDDPAGARTYAAYIDKQLSREEERRKSLEARGVLVITSSGTLATLLLGLVAIATKAGATFALPDGARLPLALALIGFTVAALLAIATNVPRKSDEAIVSGLQGLLEQYWNDPELEALRTVAQNQINVLASGKRVNRDKAYALVAAMTAETFAVGTLAWAMIEIL